MAFSPWRLTTAISGLLLSGLVFSGLLFSGTQVYAQGTPPGPAAAPQKPATQQTASAHGTSQPSQAALPRATVAPSSLQQPAREAKIVFAGDTLAIHADNSSLTAILRQFAAKSGMKIEGLGGDERVFGSFGPGAPSDVLAELLHGTTYNLILVGDLDNGAPRELILTPATGAGGAAAGASPANPGEAKNDPSNPDPSVADQANAEPEQEPQGPLDLPTPIEDPLPPAANETAAPGVKTPQQLFEQLQQLHQAEQSAPQGAQQNQQGVQQDPPPPR